MRITVVGSINLDLVATAPQLPAPGETVTGATLARHPGGKGANQALAAQRLGAEVCMIGRVGRDGMALHLSLSRRRHEQLLLLEEKPIETTATLDQYQLTPREIDVLRWVAKGKTNRDIGEILGMSPRTVNKHLEHIYVKLGVETRAAATAVVASKLAS